jgi:DNA-binding GntR family transcriptional regulator
MSLTSTVHARLKDRILRVEVRPGQVVYEADLAQEFEVSKTPIREALQLLAQSGWVVVLPRKGYLVKPVELRDIREIFALRRMIEPVLAAQAARAAAPAQVDALEAFVEQQVAAVADLDAGLAAACRFHLSLADIFGSPRTRRVLEDLIDDVTRLHYLLPTVEGHIGSSEELQAHRDVIAEIRAHDARRAHELMDAHLSEVARTLVNGFVGV